MPAVLIIGATRGLGASLACTYADKKDYVVYGTTRSDKAPESKKGTPDLFKVKWVPHIDATSSSVGPTLVNRLGLLGVGSKDVETGVKSFDVVIITAGYFALEDFAKLGEKEWEIETKTYATSAISPPFIVSALYKAKLLEKGSKVILVSSEAGSIGLRHESEGGGNFAHHASKAALNMVGKLLSLDMKDAGVIVSIVHPGFMRTEMTAGVGFDTAWEAGGAIHPDVAAESLIEWVNTLTFDMTGELWAPRGHGDIGTAKLTLGDDLELGKPLRLPW